MNWREKFAVLNNPTKMKRPESPPGVLIIHPGALGDVLLALRAIWSIRDRLPRHEVILLARKEIGGLLVEYGVIDRAIDIEGPAFSELLQESPSRNSERADFLSRCTHAVAWVTDAAGRLSENLQRIGIRHRCIGSPHDRSLQAVHQSDRYCEILDRGMSGTHGKVFSHPGTQKSNGPWLKPSIRSFQTKIFQQKVLMIHPGSGSQHKCLSPERLSCLIKRLADRDDRKIFVCQGPADVERVSLLRTYLDHVDYEILKDSTLSEIARVLRHVDVFLGHDSGITHLAAALGVPTVALFGPTDPQRWGPKGRHVEVVKGPYCQCKNWQAVQQCLEKPCLTHSVEEIVEIVERRLCGADMKAERVALVEVH